jgi:hypothetical protein
LHVATNSKEGSSQNRHRLALPLGLPWGTWMRLSAPAVTMRPPGPSSMAPTAPEPWAWRWRGRDSTQAGERASHTCASDLRGGLGEILHAPRRWRLGATTCMYLGLEFPILGPCEVEAPLGGPHGCHVPPVPLQLPQAAPWGEGGELTLTAGEAPSHRELPVATCKCLSEGPIAWPAHPAPQRAPVVLRRGG